MKDLLGIKDSSTLSYMISSVKIVFVPAWAIFIALLGLIVAKLKHRADFKKLIIIVLPLIALLIFYSFYYFKDFRFIVPGMIFLFILIGYGIDKLIGIFRSKYIKIAIGILFVLYITYSLPSFMDQYRAFASGLNITEQRILLSQKSKNKILFTNDYTVYWEEILGKKYTIYPILRDQTPLTINKGYGFTKRFVDILKPSQKNTNTYYIMSIYLTNKQWNLLTSNSCVARGDRLYNGQIIRFRCE
jgi:hypothetical protein